MLFKKSLFGTCYSINDLLNNAIQKVILLNKLFNISDLLNDDIQ